MASQKEIAAQLVAATEELKTTAAGVAKVGTEVDTLIAKIEVLTEQVANQENASQELQDAAAGVTAQVAVVKEAVNAVDNKVEDAPATPEEPTV